MIDGYIYREKNRIFKSKSIINDRGFQERFEKFKDYCRKKYKMLLW